MPKQAASQVLPPLVQKRGAVFVSATVYGAPRRCMGTLAPREPDLVREIIANACAAASHTANRNEKEGNQHAPQHR